MSCVFENGTATTSRTGYILNTARIKEMKESCTLRTGYWCLIVQWKSACTLPCITPYFSFRQNLKMFSTHLLPSSDSSNVSPWPYPRIVSEHLLPVILWLFQPCVLLLVVFPFLTKESALVRRQLELSAGLLTRGGPLGHSCWRMVMKKSDSRVNFTKNNNSGDVPFCRRV